MDEATQHDLDATVDYQNYNSSLSNLLAEYNNVLAQAQQLIDDFDNQRNENEQPDTSPNASNNVETDTNNDVIPDENVEVVDDLRVSNISDIMEVTLNESGNTIPLPFSRRSRRRRGSDNVIVLDDSIVDHQNDVIFVQESNNTNPITIDLCNDEPPVHSSPQQNRRRRRRRSNGPNRDRSRSPMGRVIIDETHNQDDVVSINEVTDTVEQSPNNSESQSNTSQLLKCAICFDTYVRRQPVTTNCGHIFCKACIEQCIQLTHKCPLCKKKLGMRQIHRIYL